MVLQFGTNASNVVETQSGNPCFSGYGSAIRDNESVSEYIDQGRNPCFSGYGSAIAPKFFYFWPITPWLFSFQDIIVAIEKFSVSL